jgi:hypothetical protein
MIENGISGKLIQIMPAVGWRVFEFTQDERGKIETKEIPVIGWGLRENGEVSLLISDPNNEQGYSGMSISERPSYLDERYRNKVVHYQAVASFQELSQVAPQARHILQVRRSGEDIARMRTEAHPTESN